MLKAALKNRKNGILFSSKMKLNLRKKLVKCYICSVALYVDGTWIFQNIISQIPRKISSVLLEKNGEGQLERSCEELLQRIKEGRNTLYTIKRRKANRLGHLLHRNCPLKYFIEKKRKKEV
jgi:hypothetical protein